VAHYQTKQCNLKVKDIDTKGRTVQIYVSEFGSKDSDGDIILPGAYKKTIAERGPSAENCRIKHLLQHSPYRLIGKPAKMEEDIKGLLVSSVLADTTDGNDALKLYEMDLFEHSVGFQTVKGEPDMTQSAYLIKEVMLWEYSSVTWGANANTPLVGIKSLSKADQHAALTDRMNKLFKALRKGTFTDETFEMLEIELKQIQDAYDGLIAPLLKDDQPGGEPTGKESAEPDSSEIREIFNVFKNAAKI
jgi:uncharacterized protein